MKMTKTIWYLHPYAGSPSIGYAGRSYYLTQEFNHLGFQAYVVSSSYHHLFHRQDLQNEKIKAELLDGVPFIWLKTNSYKKNGFSRLINMFSYAYKILYYEKELIKLTGKPDVLIVSSPHLFHYLSVYKIAKKYKAKIIFEVRDLWPLSLTEIFGISKKHPFIYFMKKIECFAYKNSDFVVSLLPNSLTYMQQKGLDSDKFFYIPNGVELPKKSTVSQPELTAAKYIETINSLKSKGKFIVGYLGGHGIPNALEQLISAMQFLQLEKQFNIHAILVGKGFQKNYLQQQATNLNNVTFLDPIPKEQVFSFLNLIDVAFIGWRALPIYKYGISPNKIFEYMLANKPILHATNTSADMVEKIGCGISILPEQPELLANTLIKFSKMSQQELEHMGNRGSKYIIENHTYHYLAEQYTKLFN